MGISNHLLFPSSKPVKWDQFSCMGLNTNNFHFRTPSLTGSQNLPGSSLLAAQLLKTQKALHLPFLMHEYISESQIKQRGWDRRFIHQPVAAPITAASQVVIWSPWSGVLKKKIKQWRYRFSDVSFWSQLSMKTNYFGCYYYFWGSEHCKRSFERPQFFPHGWDRKMTHLTSKRKQTWSQGFYLVAKSRSSTTDAHALNENKKSYGKP